MADGNIGGGTSIKILLVETIEPSSLSLVFIMVFTNICPKTRRPEHYCNYIAFVVCGIKVQVMSVEKHSLRRY